MYKILLLTAIAQTALAQSPELLELSRIRHEGTLELARAELTDCEKSPSCDAVRRLSLLTGYLLLKEGRDSEGLMQLRRHAGPEGLEMLRDYYIAEALFALRQFSEAEHAFDKVANESNLSWLSSKAEERKCLSVFMQGRWNDAVALLSRFVRRQSSPENLYMLAFSLEQSRRSSQALRYYRQIGVSYPLHPLAKWANARHRFEFTLEERMIRARRFIDGVHPAEAAEEARAAIGNSAVPPPPQLKLLFSQALISNGQTKEAMDVLASMHQDEPQWASQALLMESKEAMRQNDDATATKLLALIENSFPLTSAAPDSRFLRAFIALHSEQFDTCVNLLANFHTEHPSWQRLDEAMWYQALCHLRANEFQATQETLEKLLKRFPKSPLAIQANYWIIRAQALGGKMTEDQFHKALEKFRRKHFGSIYSLWADLYLRKMGTVPAPLLSPQPDLSIGVPPEALKTAVHIASTGLYTDARYEVMATAQRLTQPDEILAAAPFLLSVGAESLALKLAARLPLKMATRSDELLLRYPPAFHTTVERNANKFDVASSFIWAIMKRESRFSPDVESPVGARGLMQLMPKTAQAVAEELRLQLNSSERLFEPSLNIELAAWYLAALQRRFQNIALTSAAYNAGPMAAMQWATKYGHLPLDLFVECIPFRETRHYVKQVMTDEHIYRLMYAGVSIDQSFVIPKPAPDGISF